MQILKLTKYFRKSKEIIQRTISKHGLLGPVDLAPNLIRVAHKKIQLHKNSTNFSLLTFSVSVL